MANRIGRFFSAYPDRDEALEGVAQHIARYWERRMRLQLFALLDGPSAQLLTPLVADALRKHREMFHLAGGGALPIPPAGESES